MNYLGNMMHIFRISVTIFLVNPGQACPRCITRAVYDDTFASKEGSVESVQTECGTVCLPAGCIAPPHATLSSLERRSRP